MFKLCILSTQYIYVLHVIFVTTSYYFLGQYLASGLSSEHELYFLRDANCSLIRIVEIYIILLSTSTFLC